MHLKLFGGLRNLSVLGRTYTHGKKETPLMPNVVKTKRNIQEAICDGLGIAIGHKKPYAVILSEEANCNEIITLCTETTKDNNDIKRPLVLRKKGITVHTELTGSDAGCVIQTFKMLKCEAEKISKYEKLTIIKPIKEMYNYQSQKESQHHIHISGVKVVIPRGPYQAKGLLLSCIRVNAPCVFLQPNNDDDKEEVNDADYTIPLGIAEIVLEGEAVTLIGYGPQIHVLEKVATMAKEQLKVQCEVIDLKTLIPWDKKTVMQSVRKTQMCMLVEEMELIKGLSLDIEQTIQDEHLKVQKVCGTICKDKQCLLSIVEHLIKNS
ncbi:2-oxoisovalerate dehydrogenase subunit beta, mitochondrial-like [Mytilus californianus]|uniref:2-oxoisovalerate dehydrogenase subunit beta, mitochondrial-like n=1 Tax=Mytilus californianus TaxID=6549 RepID=UPI0022474E1F|nr:2-oxoisovalerate dehydrogenase subunit beta, mitochondrial-like [Mytilus californianus]